MDPNPIDSRDMSPQVSSGDIGSLVTGNTQFGIDLYHQLLKTSDGNIFFSPYSISLALAMTYAGARGDTDDQMADVLEFTLTDDNLHKAFNALDLTLKSRAETEEWDENEGFKLNIANSIWGQNNYKFLPEFLDLLAVNYGAGMKLADFANAPEESRMAINQWVENETGNRIKDLLPPGTIHALTRMILVNAIYFNASWMDPFKEENTKDGEFYTLDGDPVTVPMMGHEEKYPHSIKKGHTAITLPYHGRRLGMTIIMPVKGSFDKFENSLNPSLLNSILDSLSYGDVELKIPKFKFDSTFSLKQILSAMGMAEAFTGEADFSGMDGTRELFIDDVIHKAFVKVDEAGTEAAAATAVMMAGAAFMEQPKVVEITIDHPFIFVIWDFETKAILFIGRVLNPAE